MYKGDKKAFFFLLFFLLFVSLNAQNTKMVLIKKGSFVPLYGDVNKKTVTIDAFKMDIYPVTNEEYLSFLKEKASYRRSVIKRIFADISYLEYWKNDLDYGENNGKAPVTNVSWFAAKKYCEYKGKRLPAMDEWEYAAMADQKHRDARTKVAYNNYILGWYEKRNTFNRSVGQTCKNYWGLYDMYGLIWEWTFDFNSIFLSGESRKNRDTDTSLFCGGASVNATDLMNYAAFMRYAFRSSLKANYSSRNLGFRCACDVK
ncbi:formylglycine-generating enzyme family protein [Flavobacterium sp. WV_118_3]|jgi:hypothetical protein|uniref:formylglycine-generating enzyme family protein n=1 Tax=Flavobacterium sp. WV_118_3 TaxID=3151764 RepID=UPI003219375B